MCIVTGYTYASMLWAPLHQHALTDGGGARPPSSHEHRHSQLPRFPHPLLSRAVAVHNSNELRQCHHSRNVLKNTESTSSVKHLQAAHTCQLGQPPAPATLPNQAACTRDGPHFKCRMRGNPYQLYTYARGTNHTYTYTHTTPPDAACVGSHSQITLRQQALLATRQYAVLLFAIGVSHCLGTDSNPCLACCIV